MSASTKTGIERIAGVFDALKEGGRMAFMPFVCGGDPDPETFADLVRRIADAGADLIEIGFPYSDPIADGPVIQSAYTRVLQSGTTVSDIVRTVAALPTAELPPLVAMVSYSIVFRRGPERFLSELRNAGFSGVIVPDFPGAEADELTQLADAAEVALVQLVSPTTPEHRAAAIVQHARGFVYCISIAGTTGERDKLPDALRDQLQRLRTLTNLPLAVGFGIRQAGQIEFLRGVADGVIVGSAVVRQVAELAAASPADRAAIVDRIAGYVRSLADAAHQPSA